MRRTQVPVGVVAFTLVFLSLVPAIRAAESPEVDKNNNASEPFVLDAGVSLGVPFRPSTIDPVQHPVDSFSTNKLYPKERIILESDALVYLESLSQ